MKLASFNGPAGASWGRVDQDGIIDLGHRATRPGWGTLRGALANGGLDAIRDALGDCGSVDFALADVSLEPVIPDAGQILCIGLNYEEHRLETRREATGHPTVFARYAQSQMGHGAPIVRPRESTTLDYEGELAIIIGSTARRVRAEDAMGVVAGYACYNDVSVREFQRHTTQFHPGKNFPSTGAFGPWMVTSDEVPDYEAMTIQTRVNGQVMQSAGLDQLIFSIPKLIAYCSIFTELRPGDVIVTGTPGGVGAGRTPPVWLKGGDLVEVEVSGIGILANTVVDENP